MTNAIYSAAHTVTGGTAATTLKAVDAANGIYAVTVTPNAGVTSISVTPRWIYPNGAITYTGTAITVPVAAAITITQPMYSYSDSFGAMNGIYEQYMTLKIHPSLGDLTGAVITGLSIGGYIMPIDTFPVAVTDMDDRIFRVKCRSRSSAGATINAQYPIDVFITIGGVAKTISMYYPCLGMAANVEAATSLTTNGGELILTASAGSNKLTGNILSWDIIDRNGVVFTGYPGEVTYGTDSKYRLGVPPLTTRKNCRVVVRLTSGYMVIGGDIDIVQLNDTGETT